MSTVETQEQQQEKQNLHDVEKAKKLFKELCTPFSMYELPLNDHDAKKLLSLGPRNFVFLSIRRSGNWAKRTKEAPGKTAPGMSSLLKSIADSIRYYVAEDIKKGTAKNWVPPTFPVQTQEVIAPTFPLENIREQFQDKVGIHGTDLWTLTEEETADLLRKHNTQKILKTIDNLSDHVRTKRNEENVTLSQEDVVDLLYWELAKV